MLTTDPGWHLQKAQNAEKKAAKLASDLAKQAEKIDKDFTKAGGFEGLYKALGGLWKKGVSFLGEVGGILFLRTS